MAYVVQAVSAITDIPVAVAAIAVSNGWTVDSTVPAQPIFTLPTDYTSIKWRLSAAIASQDHTLTWAASGSAIPTSSANTRSPKLAPPSGTTPTVPAPTKIHVFISPGSPLIASPYLAIVIEYNTNLFRHLYLGSMEKIGNYTGGEIVSAEQGPHTSVSVSIAYNDYDRVQRMFGSRSACWGNTLCGGVRVTHTDNANEWRKFLGWNTGTMASFPADSVLGGYFDGINDGLVINGECNFAGHNALIPVNLFTTKVVGADATFTPIGSPPGVRLVNMRNFDPGAVSTVGGVNWRVFPGLAKNSTPDMPSAGAPLGHWRTFESSHYIGYAYRET